MIPMNVRHQHIDLQRCLTVQQRFTEIPNTATGIDDYDGITAADFDARRVATVPDSIGPWYWYTSAYAPEFNCESIRHFGV